MRCLRIGSIVALGFFSFAAALLAQERPEFRIYATGEDSGATYDFQTGLAIATNGVMVRYLSTVLTADKLWLNQESGEAIAEGAVRVEHEGLLWVGEHIRYNFKTHEMQAEQFRTGRPPFFAAGEGLQADITNHVFFATNSFITTEDLAEPELKIHAQYLKIIPGKRVEARKAVLYLGDMPVFYFPYYSRNIGPRANNLNFIPGYRSRFGPFILGSYVWFLNEQLDGTVHLDYRERRGVGGGPDFNFHLGRWGEGTFKYYYLYDQEPNADVKDVPLPENRQRVYFSYQGIWATNLEARSMVRYQSDFDVTREFFEREYRQNPYPSTYVELTRFWQNFSLDTYVQPRINDFLETVERLPDVRLTGFRQQVGASPIYYESESSAGYYQRVFPATNEPVPLDFSAARADTYHQLLLPETFFGWLNFTPRVGGRFTYYGHASGAGATTEEVYRGVFNTGAEVSFKASRLWPETRSKWLDLDGLRHIIEPSANYVYVPTPSTRPPDLPQFDYELPSLRLLPNEFHDYNSIDSIDSQNVIRWGLHNKLQTKRNGQLDNLLNWDLYTDWRLKPRDDQTTFSDLYSDLTLKPRSWLTAESLIRQNLSNGDLRMSLSTLTLQPSDVWSWSFGHFYLRDDFSTSPTALGEGNNLFTSSIFYRLNENWGFRATHHYEARDGRMEEQYYSIYRDMRSWTAALTFRLRDNRNGPDDFTVAFTFSLKAHPRYGLGTDSVRPYSLLGG